MRQNCIEEYTTDFCSSNFDFKVDSPEDFKAQDYESPNQTTQEPYCQWLDDLGWI